MIKQGWLRREKIQARDLVPKGTLPAGPDNMRLNILIKPTYSFWSVEITKLSPGESDFLIRGFVHDNRPTFKAAIDAFAIMWNKGMISGGYYKLPEAKRSSLNDMYSTLIGTLRTENQREMSLRVVSTWRLVSNWTVMERSQNILTYSGSGGGGIHPPFFLFSSLIFTNLYMIL